MTKLKDVYEISLSILPQLNNIIHPLRTIGINNFSYYKVYKNGKSFYVCSDETWHRMHYFSKDGFDGLKRTIYESTSNNINTVIFSGNPNKPESDYHKLYGINKPMNVSKMIENNLWNSISYYRFNDNYFEAYNLFGGNDKTELGKFFKLNQLYLTKFISHFATEFNPLLQSINFNYWALMTDVIFSTKNNGVPNNIELLSKTGSLVNLTSKQVQILDLLIQGKPIKVIEDQLDISSNAIINYLNRVKAKLVCSSTNEILRLYNASKK
ncbi:MAG: hypothetical protein J0M23_06995 [Rickettsiales bacterium]|nr:hypothetical protein [Rickettsiales bacterium]